MEWEIIVMPLAEKQLAALSDKRVQRGIERVIDGLEVEPEKKGKALTANLKGLRSIRAVGQRYRIIYRVDTDATKVFIVALGIRKEGDKTDIYALAKRLVQAGLLSLLILLCLAINVF